MGPDAPGNPLESERFGHEKGAFRGPSELSAPDWVVELPYERSLSPDLIVFTESTSVGSAVEDLLQLAESVAHRGRLRAHEGPDVRARDPGVA